MSRKIAKPLLAAGLAVACLCTYTPAHAKVPTLSATMCRDWGGSWQSGKNASCTISTGAALYAVDSVVIPRKMELVIDKEIFVQGRITVKGVLTNFGYIHVGVDDLGGCAVSGAIDNYGTFTNKESGVVDIYGQFVMRTGSNVTNSGTVNAFASADIVNEGITTSGSFPTATNASNCTS